MELNMEAFLVAKVELKPDVAAQVAKFMDETYELETPKDLKHLSQEDIDNICTKTGLKKISAGKLVDAWEKLKAAGEAPPFPLPGQASSQGSSSEGPASPKTQKGFLPGYSDAKEGAETPSAMRLMYLSEEGAVGKRELVVDHDMTSSLFEGMFGDALLVAVFGPARCGKSFLMNLLSGYKDLFEVAHGNLPCTQGVFISPQQEGGAMFRRRADTLAVTEAAAKGKEAAPVVAVGASFAASATVSYVDVEGLGDKGKAYDVHLIAPLLLVSKILMYNWKGAPNKHVMLESLLTLGEAAQRVHVGDRAGGKSGAAPIFGHLVVLLRDWHTTDNVYDLLFKDEADKGDDAIKARNRARKLVLGAFESITIRCLPYPGLDPSDSNMTNLSQHFVGEYLELREHLVALSSNPLPQKLFDGKPLDGPTISSILPLLAKTLNSDEDLLPREVWRLMEEHRLHKLLGEFKEELHAWVQAKEDSGALPTTVARCTALGLELVAFGAGDHGQLSQLDDLGWLSAETRASTKASYGAYLAEQVQLLEAKNERSRAELKGTLDAALAAHAAALKASLDAEVRPRFPAVDAEALETDLAARTASAAARLAAEHAPLGARALEVLEVSLGGLFQALADDLCKGAASANRDMLGRAESVLLRTVGGLKEALQAARRRSEAEPTPERDVLASVAALKATALGEVRAGLAFVVAECKGRASFVDDQCAEAGRLAAADLAEVAAAWPKHCAGHLDQAAGACVAQLKATVQAKYYAAEGSMPVKSGELELFAAGELKASMGALGLVAAALGLAHDGEAAAPAVVSRKADLTARLEVEFKALRAKNAELLRKVAAPDPPTFGKLLGADGSVSALVLVPQPNPRFSERAVEVEVERKPSAGGTASLTSVGAGDVSVEVAAKGLANGKAYTFTARARNANGWGAWSAGAQCVPFGKPPPPRLGVGPGACTPGDGSVTLRLDFGGAGDNGSAVTSYVVGYAPSGGGGGGAAGEATVAVDPASPLTVACAGLVNGVAYDFTVRAVNQAGAGEPSAPVRCSPAPPPPRPRVARVLPMDAALQVALASDNNAAPDPLAAEEGARAAGGAGDVFAVTSYEVTTRVFNTYSLGPPETKVFPAGAVNTFIIRGLTNGSAYNVTVVAVNSIGKSPPSGIVVATPNTTWGTMKRFFSFCWGPAASSQAVVEQPRSSDAAFKDSRTAAAKSPASPSLHTQESADIEFGDVYAKKK